MNDMRIKIFESGSNYTRQRQLDGKFCAVKALKRRYPYYPRLIVLRTVISRGDYNYLMPGFSVLIRKSLNRPLYPAKKGKVGIGYH
jgi:hypothetical protein